MSRARKVYVLGFNVASALDVMADLSLEAHDHSVIWIFPSLGETGSLRDIVGRLVRR